MEKRRRVKCTSISIGDTDINKEDLLNEFDYQQNQNSPKENKFLYQKINKIPKEKLNLNKSPIQSQNNPYGNTSTNLNFMLCNIHSKKIPLGNCNEKGYDNDLNNSSSCTFNKNNFNLKTEKKQIKYIKVDNKNNKNIISAGISPYYNNNNKENKIPISNPYFKKFIEENKSKENYSFINDNNNKRIMTEEIVNNSNNFNMTIQNNLRKCNSKNEENHAFNLSYNNNNKNEFNLLCLSDDEKYETKNPNNVYEINKEDIINEIKKEMQNEFKKCKQILKK